MDKVSGGLLPAKKNPLAMFGDSPITFMLHLNEIDFKDIEFLKMKYYDQMVKGENTKKPFIKIRAAVKITDTKAHPAAPFLKKFVLTSEYIFTLTFTLKMVKATVSIKEIKLPGNLRITGAGLYIYVKYAAPADFDFGIKGALHIPLSPTQEITLGGRIIISPTAGGFEFYMKGIISKPFLIPRVHFGDLRLKAKFGYESGAPSNLEFEGTIALGKKCFKGNTFIGIGYCLKGSGGIGINTRDPEGNYFFVKLSGLTLSILATSIAGDKSKKIPVPGMLNSNMKFPKGIFFSFSGAEKKVGKLTLSAGIKIKANIVLFKVPASIEFLIDPKTQDAKIALIVFKAVKYKGMIMGRSMKEKAKGPTFRGSIKNKQMAGSLKFYCIMPKLKFEAEASAKLDKTGLTMHVKGSLFGKFKAEFNLAIKKKSGKVSIKLDGSIDLGSFLKKLVAKVETALSLLMKFPVLKIPKLKIPKIKFMQVNESEFNKNRESFIEKYGNVKSNFESRKVYLSMTKKKKKEPLFSVQKTTFNLVMDGKKMELKVTFFITLLKKKKVLKVIFDPFNPVKTIMSFVKAAIKVMFK